MTFRHLWLYFLEIEAASQCVNYILSQKLDSLPRQNIQERPHSNGAVQEEARAPSTAVKSPLAHRHIIWKTGRKKMVKTQYSTEEQKKGGGKVNPIWNIIILPRLSGVIRGKCESFWWRRAHEKHHEERCETERKASGWWQLEVVVLWRVRGMFNLHHEIWEKLVMKTGGK